MVVFLFMALPAVHRAGAFYLFMLFVVNGRVTIQACQFAAVNRTLKFIHGDVKDAFFTLFTMAMYAILRGIGRYLSGYEPYQNDQKK
jgi:hypothetical protein